MDAAAGQVSAAVRMQFAVGDAGRDDDRVRGDGAAIVKANGALDPFTSRAVAVRAVMSSAPNFSACMRARSASGYLTPRPGSPR